MKAIAEAIADLTATGFPTHFEIEDDDVVHCLSCRSRCRPADVSWLSRVEVSGPTPGRTRLVCGLRCPVCGAQGTATARVEQWEHRRRPYARRGAG